MAPARRLSSSFGSEKSSSGSEVEGRREVDWEDREVMKRNVVIRMAESRAKAVRRGMVE